MKRKKKKEPINWRQLGLELLVVFLGVTAGFILNNWRSSAQENLLRDKYLTSFHRDISQNIEDLKKSIDADSLWLVQGNAHIEQMANKTFPPDSAGNLMRTLINIRRFDVNEGTFKDMSNSGNLNLINDFSLKSALVDYQIDMQGLSLIDNMFIEYFNRQLMPYMQREFDLLTFTARKGRKIDITELSNLFTVYFALVDQRKYAHSEALRHSVQLQKRLEEDIKL